MARVHNDRGVLRTIAQSSVATGHLMDSGIIHDLGNLIQIATSAVNIVAGDPCIRAAGLESVIGGAKTSLERAGELVRHRIRVDDSAPMVGKVSPAACLLEIEAIIRGTLRQGVLLDVRAIGDVPLVECDPLAFQNAVLNLLFNARDAMPDGGTISVRAEAISLESSDGVELRVADSGIGMKPETIAHVFEPYFTTKCDGLGGIGLAMVERFALECGGRVLIESEYGVGTTVRLQLPASAQSRWSYARRSENNEPTDHAACVCDASTI